MWWLSIAESKGYLPDELLCVWHSMDRGCFSSALNSHNSYTQPVRHYLIVQGHGWGRQTYDPSGQPRFIPHSSFCARNSSTDPLYSLADKLHDARYSPTLDNARCSHRICVCSPNFHITRPCFLGAEVRDPVNSSSHFDHFCPIWYQAASPNIKTHWQLSGTLYKQLKNDSSALYAGPSCPWLKGSSTSRESRFPA